MKSGCELTALTTILREYLGRDDIVLTPDSMLSEEYDLSSFDLIELVTIVEDGFSVRIPDDRIRSITTAGKLCALIDELKNGPDL